MRENACLPWAVQPVPSADSGQALWPLALVPLCLATGQADRQPVLASGPGDRQAQGVPVRVMDVDALLPGFTHLFFERINPARNEARFYYIAWEPTLFEAGAVVRIYGRKGGHRRVMAPAPFSSLTAAWPFIRAIIRRRIAHGYKLVAPAVACSGVDGLGW